MAPDSPQKVVAISLRGASHEAWVHRAGELGDESTLARLVSGGSLSVLRPIANAETFPAMATFESGAWPSRHGIVGNSYHVAGDPISRGTVAYSAAVLTSETLWEAAQRQGKRVIRLGTLLPRGSTDGAATEATDPVRSMPQAEQLSYGRVVELMPVIDRPAQRVELEDGETTVTTLEPATDATPLAIEVRVDEPFAFQIYASGAMDSTTDEVFDRVVLDDDPEINNGVLATLRPGEWAPIVVRRGTEDGSPTVGSWVKLLELDATSGNARLYLRPPHRHRASPAEFANLLDEVLGFAPGAPDYSSFAQGLIDANTVLEDIEREVNYVVNAALYALEYLDFDLMLIDNPVLDRVGHPFHVVDPRQEAWSEDAAAITEDRWRWAYRLADAGLESMASRLAALSESQTTALVLTSEYGFFPAHTRVAIHRLLADAGFRITGDDTTEVRAFTSSASAHFRFQPDLTEIELETQIEQLTDVLRDFRDPRTGEQVFDVVASSDQLARYHLDHPTRAGDLWARLHPGYTFHGSTDIERSLLGPPRFAGDHGYAPRQAAAQGFFLLHGSDLTTALPTEIEAVDVAVTLAGLLGIEPPNGSEGRDALAATDP